MKKSSIKTQKSNFLILVDYIQKLFYFDYILCYVLHNYTFIYYTIIHVMYYILKIPKILFVKTNFLRPVQERLLAS